MVGSHRQAKSGIDECLACSRHNNSETFAVTQQLKETIFILMIIFYHDCKAIVTLVDRPITCFGLLCHRMESS